MAFRQAPRAIMMVRPTNFGYNEETARSNAFQQADGKEKVAEIRKAAIAEFDNCVKQLRDLSVEVLVFEPRDNLDTPDQVFPNNWVSFHEDGKVIIYPMLAPSRRLERRMEFITALDKQYGYNISDIIDLSHYERVENFLEGTGSLVLDYQNNISYANTSPRTHSVLIREVVDLLNYENCQFEAVDDEGQDIYHTNVMMCVAAQFAVICLESINDNAQRTMVEQRLLQTGHEIIAINRSQMGRFAGNMMEITNQSEQSLTVMSQNALESLDEDQKAAIRKYSKIVALPIPTIEKYGGGSIRCMIAGIFLPKK